MSALPKVTVLFSDGNLLANAAVIDGIGAIVGTVQTLSLKGVVKTVYSLPDAEAQGYTATAEADMHRHLAEFYAQVGGNQELWVLGLDDTATMTDMLTDSNPDGAQKLIQAAGGKIRLLAVYRRPPIGYDASTAFIDADVPTAVTAGKVFAEKRLAELRPLRIMIEGRISDETSATIYEPKTAGNNYTGVVLGGSVPGHTASVGAVLGRAVRYGAHIKLGKVANGPMVMANAYIGSKKVSEMLNLESLHEKGYISFMTHPQKAGVYLGKDNMCNTGDYRFLSNGRVVDKAAVIAALVFVNRIQGEVTVDSSGRISEESLFDLKGQITQQINVNMAEQISTLDVVVEPDQNIVSTGKLGVRLNMTPLGYTSDIDVTIGLSN
jgi:hypothetical protein